MSDEDLVIENQFCPCAVEKENNLTQVILAAGGESKKPLSFLIPVSFFFEYIFYLTMKKEGDLYYSRCERAAQAATADNLYSIVVSCLCIL